MPQPVALETPCSCFRSPKWVLCPRRDHVHAPKTSLCRSALSREGCIFISQPPVGVPASLGQGLPTAGSCNCPAGCNIGNSGI